MAAARTPVQRLGDSIKRMGSVGLKAFALLGGAALAATTLLVRQQMKVVDALQKTSLRLGIATADLAALGILADQNAHVRPPCSGYGPVPPS